MAHSLDWNVHVHSFLPVFVKFSTGFLFVRVGWPPSLLVWLCILHWLLFACIPTLLVFTFVYIVSLGLLWHVLAWMVDGWRLRLVKTCKKLGTSKLVKNWTCRFGKLIKTHSFLPVFYFWTVRGKLVENLTKTEKKTARLCACRKLKKNCQAVFYGN